jgi:hypothetical protein
MPPDVRRGKAFDQILRQMLCPYPSSGCGVIASNHGLIQQRWDNLI